MSKKFFSALKLSCLLTVAGLLSSCQTAVQPMTPTLMLQASSVPATEALATVTATAVLATETPPPTASQTSTVTLTTTATIIETTSPSATATNLPPTAVPPTAVPPTAVPPTAVPPTAVPPTAVPPTAVPPTAVPPTTVPPTTVPPTAVPPTAVPTEPAADPNYAPQQESVWDINVTPDSLTGTCSSEAFNVPYGLVAITPQGNALTWKDAGPAPYTLYPYRTNVYGYEGRSAYKEGYLRLVIQFTSATSWVLTSTTTLDADPQCQHVHQYTATLRFLR
jgi:hypothetical protein